MTLIGIWGPTVASVANLLTIGLVAVMDAVWMGRIPDLQTIGGAGLICGGFAALLWEGDVEG
jgi:drug/metabolite transporter (DMT)-like permease